MNFLVFLIDDNVGVLNGLTTLLRSANYDVRAYSSPHDFLAKHDPAVPGCVVLDMDLPGLDGLSLQEKLRNDGVEWPIVFLSGTVDASHSVQAMKAGAADFLLKPVHAADLFAAIERARALQTQTIPNAR